MKEFYFFHYSVVAFYYTIPKRFPAPAEQAQPPPRRGFCVTSFGFLPHENFLRVLPRRCRTDLTHVPIAADSFVPRRALIVFRTFLMQRQNFFAREFAICSDYKFEIVCANTFLLTYSYRKEWLHLGTLTV